MDDQEQVPDLEGTLEVPSVPAVTSDVPTAPAVTSDVPTAPPIATADPLSGLGEAGYARLIELLSKPPIDAPGLPPPGTGVPTDLKEWLRAFKEPLVYVTVDAAKSAVMARVGGYTRGRLKELYAQMTPEQIRDVMLTNAATLKKHADKRVSEAVLVSSIADRLTQASAGYLLSALALI